MSYFSKNIYPKALKPGGHIAVVAPASWADNEWMMPAEKSLEDKGYKVSVHSQCFNRNHAFAGTDKERVSALHEVFADKTVDAVFCARGGNGAVYILDKIDFSLIKKNPKIFIGYSDITALHSSIYKKTGLITFHGPVFTEFGQGGYDEYSLTSTLNLLSGQRNESVFESVVANRPCDVTGYIIVGNVSLINALLGTAWEPDLRGAVLMIEEIAEETSHLDRILWQWRACGYLNKIKALVVGRFSDMKDSGSISYGISVNEIIARHTAGLDIPVITGVSFGHKGRNPAIPYGVSARFTVAGSRLTVKFLNQPVE